MWDIWRLEFVLHLTSDQASSSSQMPPLLSRFLHLKISELLCRFLTYGTASLLPLNYIFVYLYLFYFYFCFRILILLSFGLDNSSYKQEIPVFMKSEASSCSQKSGTESYLSRMNPVHTFTSFLLSTPRLSMF